MPPNLKFPTDTSNHVNQITAVDFYNSNQNNNSNKRNPTPSTAGDTDDFFLHDIEEAGNTTAPDSSRDSTAHIDNNEETMITATSTTMKKKKVSLHVDDEMEEERLDDEDPSMLVKRFVKKYSSLVSDPGELSIDSNRLQRAVRDAGEYAVGVQAIAVWTFDDDYDRLVQPEGGWWSHPDLPRSDALERLINPAYPTYVPPTNVSPGTDIAGILWMESSNQTNHVGGGPSIIRHVLSGSSLNRNISHDALSSAAANSPVNAMRSLQLVWRDLKSLLDDPDTAKGPRLELLSRAGFDKATGIRFQNEVNQGIVIFLASKSNEGNADDELINSMANVSYIRQSAHFIGASLAMTDVRRASRAHQEEIALQHGEYSFRTSLDVAGQQQKNTKKRHVEGPKPNPVDPNDDDQARKAPYKCCVMPQRMKAWKAKVRGGGMQVPPSLSYRQSLWTTVGAFCGLLVLSSLNEYYQYLSDGDYLLLIGPFGALMTLQYGLTAAPASQPRNAILGQAVAGAVSLASTYIPESILAIWLRRAVGPAVAIGVMVKCGVTHPPAGAHAVLYASGKYNFGFYALVVFSTVISVIPATVVNNLSVKRQYPTYWGVTPNCLTLQRLWSSKTTSRKGDSERTGKEENNRYPLVAATKRNKT